MSVTPAVSPQTAADPPDDRHQRPGRRWWVLAVVSLAQLMIVLDTTIINVALPSAQADLGIADGQRQWLVTAYALAFGSLLLLGGRVGDLLGRKRTFVGALVLFAVASAVGGVAPSFEVLVAARVVQGVAAAMLAPAALSTMITTFTDARERVRAFGIYASVAVGGGAVGLLLGGALTQYLSWRWTMYVNVIIAAVALLGAVVFMTRDRPTGGARLDLLGVVLASGGLLALVFGFSQAESAGWGSVVTIASLGLGVVLLLGFALAQLRVAAPLLPPRVVADRSRAVAYASLSIASFAMFGLFLFLTYYLQEVRGYSPLLAGVAFLPMIAALITSANLTGSRTLPRVGPRVVIPTGMAVGALALGYLSLLDVSSSYAVSVLPALIGMGLGMGMIVSPSMTTATSGVRADDAGVASALVNAMQQVGGAIGTAVLSTVAATVTASALAGSRGDGAGLAAEAATQGYTTAFAISAGVFAVGAVMGALLFPSRARAAQAAPRPEGEGAGATGEQTLVSA